MWFEYFTERIGGPTVFETMASRPRRVDAVHRVQGRDAPERFGGVRGSIETERELGENEARVSERPGDGRRKGRPDAVVGKPTNFYSVTGSGKVQRRNRVRGAEDALTDAGDTCPPSPTSKTRPEGTRNTVYAKYAFGVRR